ncbi:hypothetical protein GCM10011502_27890 [Oceanisphaera marina]|uniref:Polysaccharide chain length determinant N-terminal domain-containing protein n=1 Tax=Oceanisphaera marina TaxID=2017550 RepID=A0ABQ1IY92_9GAMM|nr:Wzz/FepE/Etk N-terminal domain-containing protein [Oceanisphaera marina]GGB53134.1 hypothetical protein GCM10011502_27890 [Oceanisphaera marina]
MNQLSQKQDAQFSQPLPPYTYHNDEISLVDLAKTLVKRWKVMAVVFGGIVAIALVFALVAPPKYEYITIYDAAESNVNSPFESVDDLQAKISSVYLPQQTRLLLKNEQLEKLPFEIEVSSPKGASLIKLSSKAKEADGALVRVLHQSVTKQLKDDQERLINKKIAMLQKRLDASKQQLEFVLSTNDNKSGEIAANLMASISALELEIIAFNTGTLIAIASQSLEPKGIGKSLIMMLALVLGAMLAIIVAFFAEFAGRVRMSLKEEEN